MSIPVFVVTEIPGHIKEELVREFARSVAQAEVRRLQTLEYLRGFRDQLRMNGGAA